jgi:GNAT superfamily N-acetyltransferase
LAVAGSAQAQNQAQNQDLDQETTLKEASQQMTKQEVRHWRRLASDPSLDFYVAEQAGSLQGMVLVGYLRSLHNPGWRASLDITVLASAAEGIGQALLDFAKARARKRGCQLMCIQDCQAIGLGDEELLKRNGFSGVGTLLSCTLS